MKLFFFLSSATCLFYICAMIDCAGGRRKYRRICMLTIQELRNVYTQYILNSIVGTAAVLITLFLLFFQTCVGESWI